MARRGQAQLLPAAHPTGIRLSQLSSPHKVTLALAHIRTLATHRNYSHNPPLSPRRGQPSLWLRSHPPPSLWPNLFALCLVGGDRCTHARLPPHRPRTRTRPPLRRPRTRTRQPPHRPRPPLRRHRTRPPLHRPRTRLPLRRLRPRPPPHRPRLPLRRPRTRLLLLGHQPRSRPRPRPRSPPHRLRPRLRPPLHRLRPSPRRCL